MNKGHLLVAINGSVMPEWLCEANKPVLKPSADWSLFQFHFLEPEVDFI